MSVDTNAVSGGKVWTAPKSRVSKTIFGHPITDTTIVSIISNIVILVVIYWFMSRKALSNIEYSGVMTPAIWEEVNAETSSLMLTLLLFFIAWVIGQEFSYSMVKVLGGKGDIAMKILSLFTTVIFAVGAFFWFGAMEDAHTENNAVKTWLLDEYNYELNDPAMGAKNGVSVTDLNTGEDKLVSYYEFGEHMIAAENEEEFFVQIEELKDKE